MCSNRPWLNDERGTDNQLLPNAIFQRRQKLFIDCFAEKFFCCYSKKINNCEGQYDLIL